MKQKFKQICRLSKKDAENSIRDEKTVMYKHGVWNSYEERRTEEVIDCIRRCDFGADVDLNTETGVFYVCIPSHADMW